MWHDDYQEPREVFYRNPFEKQIKNLRGNPEVCTHQLLDLIEAMSEYIGKLEAKINKLKGELVE